MSAVLQECKEYISFAYLSQLTGISKAMLSQYACGTRRPKPAQRDRIVGGIHQIGQTCMQVGVVTLLQSLKMTLIEFVRYTCNSDTLAGIAENLTAAEHHDVVVGIV